MQSARHLLGSDRHSFITILNSYHLSPTIFKLMEIDLDKQEMDRPRSLETFVTCQDAFGSPVPGKELTHPLAPSLAHRLR